MMDDREYTLTADRWAYGGEVIARREDGKAVFIPYVLPGETVKVRIVEEKRGFARAALLEVLKPAPERITPRCQHFTACGGCHYQHFPYEMQTAAKTEILKDQLIRIGKIDHEFASSVIRPIIPSPEPWHYRNHMQFHQHPSGQLGFQAPRTNKVVPIKECFLPEALINVIWPQLDLEPIPGLQRIGLRAGSEDEIMLVLESNTDEGVEFELDIPLSAVQLGPNSVHVLSDSPYLEMQALNYTFQVSAGSFFQVNTHMAEKMITHLMENLPLTPESVVLDVYCGVGLFSAFIAPKVSRLIGIEANPFAADDFTTNLDAFDNVEVYEDSAGRVLPNLDVQPDIILIDPPRSGLDHNTLDAIISLKPAALAYISCNPSTLARDAKRLLDAGFILRSVTPFDLFPQTFHIESISYWQFGE